MFQGKGVYTMLSYKEFLLIALHEGGLLKYKMDTKTLSLHDFPEVDKVMLRCLMMSKEEELWVGTNNGIYIYNVLTGSCTNVKNDSFDSHSLSNNTVTTMYTDREKGIWVGTLYGGLNYQSRSAENFTVYIPMKRPRSSGWERKMRAVRFSIRICLFLLRSIRILLLRSPVSGKSTGISGSDILRMVWMWCLRL